MLDSLKQARRDLSRGLSRTLEHIAEGWRELVHRSSDALTHFTHTKHEVAAPAGSDSGGGTGIAGRSCLRVQRGGFHRGSGACKALYF